MCVNPRDQFHVLAGQTPEEAKFFWTGGPLAVAERTYFASLFSGVTAFDTDDGIVLVDTGLRKLAPGIAMLLRQQSTRPIHTAVYTHGHVDHAFGLGAYLSAGQPAPRVIAHRNVVARFERYQKTPGHNAALNARQFDGSVAGASQDVFDTFGYPEHPPDVLFDEHLDLEVGGVTFQLHHCKGETDDHTWVYCPTRGVLCPGDLLIWGVPNAGNPQKAQRYPWEWARGLRKMAALAPRTICPGHGGPIIDDPELAQRMLLETADLLETVVERTLALLEAGSPPHVDIVRKLEVPRSDSPWLQPVYDEVEFIARNVIRHFGGWYSGRPSELKPAPRESLAREVVALAGGVDAFLRRALTLSDEGDHAVACHLADSALEADPANEEVRTGVATIYERRAASEQSLMTINLYRSAAAYARAGRPFA
ncbi:MAG: MBL fold metallo-hydrolase [Deltaproteobacteria bacterium]|nr:MBL fold metallo-hydrolase [Deltaproteobacteria bacterium]